jgi:di/tripeptidase
MSALANLEPQLVWNHFEKLAAIPRASRKEAAAREYVRGIAASASLETIQDPAGNLIVRKPGRPGRDFVFGRPAKLIAMHAGLECGVIGEKYPGMQLISFGPTIVDPHSPHERVKISSVENFWIYLKSVLESL